MNNESIILRVRQLVHESGLTDSKFSTLIDMEKSGFSKRMRGQVAIGSGVINKIVIALRINKEWLLTGVGEKYIKQNQEINIAKISDFVLVPVITSISYSDYIRYHKSNEYIQKLYSIPSKIDSSYKGEFRIFQVEGDAMFDGTNNSILSNDLVLGRELKINRINLLNESMYGRLFIVISDVGVILRKFIIFDPETDTICLGALNTLYNNIIIPIENLLEIYNIVKIIDREI